MQHGVLTSSSIERKYVGEIVPAHNNIGDNKRNKMKRKLAMRSRAY